MAISMDRSYQAENARSRPLPEAKLPWASPVVGWVTTCEPDVTICLLHLALLPSFILLPSFELQVLRKEQGLRTTLAWRCSFRSPVQTPPDTQDFLVPP